MGVSEMHLAVQPYFDKLAALPTPEAIRDFLIAEGVRGCKHAPESCALAAYMTANSEIDVSVGYNYIVTYGSCDDALGETLAPPTPAMRDFIVRFDNGEYPELVVV